jgi:hypothetical protein
VTDEPCSVVGAVEGERREKERERRERKKRELVNAV